MTDQAPPQEFPEDREWDTPPPGPPRPTRPLRRRGDFLWFVGFCAVIAGIIWGIWKLASWGTTNLPDKGLIDFLADTPPVERGCIHIALAILLAAFIARRRS